MQQKIFFTFFTKIHNLLTIFVAEYKKYMCFYISLSKKKY